MKMISSLNEVKVSTESNRRQRNYKISTDLQHHLGKFKALLAIAYNVVFDHVESFQVGNSLLFPIS
jgi:hypothetical protein